MPHRIALVIVLRVIGYSYLAVDYGWLNDLHICYKEAICVALAAYCWTSAWQNRTGVVCCDNAAAVAMLNKGSTKNPHMMMFLRRLFWLSALFNFHLIAYQILASVNVERLTMCLIYMILQISWLTVVF